MESEDEALIVEESLIMDDMAPEDNDVLKEAWPILPDNGRWEFEDYLAEIGLRF